MKLCVAVVTGCVAYFGCADTGCLKTGAGTLCRVSPDGRNEIRAALSDDSAVVQVFRDGRPLIAPSRVALLCADGVRPKLELRARNSGVAYRWRTEAAGKVRVLDETIDLRSHSSEQKLLVQPGAGDWQGDPLQNCWQNPARQMRVGELSSATNALYFAPIVFINETSAMAVTESDLRDYPGWNVRRSSLVSNELSSVFARWPTATVNEDLGRRRTDSVSRYLRVTGRTDYLVDTDGTRTFPWRVFMLADTPRDLIGNRLVCELAAPSRVPDAADWVRPGKVAWDWWNDWNLTDVDFKSACDTRTYEHYIDFAASNRIAYVIMDEGWSERLNIWKFAPDVDVPHLIRYAEARGVGIILWAAWAQVFGREEEVAERFGRMGAKGFKIDFIDRDDAVAVQFVEKFASVCARRHLVVDYHGMYKPTGLEVTYPNILNYEGVHGLEMMKFHADEGMMANDINILFTRMLAGPVDYTPGAMRNFARGTYTASLHEPGSYGTRARQMALVALYDAPLQMLCDSPSQYRANAECLTFMAETPETWDEVRPLAGEPDEFAVLAKRKGDVWYVAGITDWTPRTVELDLSFLPRQANLEGFFDTADAATRPTACSHRREALPADGKLSVRMGPGGGFVLKSVLPDVELLKDLIRIPSVSADIVQVNRVVDFARADFARRGLFCEVLTNAVGRQMLWVANVADRKPDVVFSSHLDVVPAQDPQQFDPREADGWLYGRGAADSKGHVVMDVRVMEDLKGKVSVGAIIGTDEEIGGSTTREMMDLGFGARELVIVADVLPYTLTTWQKGLADYVIRIRKPALHQGIKTGPLPSAIVDLMDGYRRLAAKLPEYEDGTWREMFTCMEIGGERDDAFMRLRVRPTSVKDWPRIERWINECIGGEVTCTRKGDPVYVDEKDPLVRSFLSAMCVKWPGKDCRYLHYNSSTDARHMQYLGRPMLILGLETSDMHARNERLRLASLGEYAELIEAYLLEHFANIR